MTHAGNSIEMAKHITQLKKIKGEEHEPVCEDVRQCLAGDYGRIL